MTIKGKSGKWYKTKAAMLAAEPEETVEKKTPAKKEIKETPEGQKKASRTDAIVKVLKDNLEGLSKEDLIEKVNQFLGINRKSWSHGLWEAKKTGKITYDKEKKLFMEA